MGQRWDDYEKSAEKGPLSLGFKVIIGLVALLLAGGAAFYALSWFSEAGGVAREEGGPRAAVKKYSWFKDAAQALQAKKANIEASEAGLAAAKEEWRDVPPTEVPRDAREAIELRRKELLGLKANFNQLAAEYNANVRKVHWEVFNTENLPNAFTEYVSQ